MTAKKNITKKADFELFQKEAEYWIDKFSLREWKFVIEHRNHRDIDDALAWYATKWQDRLCNIGLSPNWGTDEITPHELCKSAFHEVCETLLTDLRVQARIDACPTDLSNITAYTHSIIRRLEWAVWEPDWKARQ